VGASVIATSLPAPAAARHLWHLDRPVYATAIRVLVSDNNMCIDELEAYSQTL